MSKRLDGRTAIVTGASRGLGRAIALALAADGANVAVVARTEKVWNDKLPGTIGETVAAIEALGGSAVAIRGDLLEPGEAKRIHEQTTSAFGPVSILVNNAAFTAPGRPPKEGETPKSSKPAPLKDSATHAAVKADWPAFLGTPLGAYKRHFEIAVFASYELMQFAAADMMASGGGAIINISSGASHMPGDGPYPNRSGGVLPGYGGSKAALEHLTKSAAFDLQPHNISVNALSPSRAILTPGVQYYSQQFDNYGSEIDFAEATVRLALVNPNEITGRVVGHLQVLDGTFAAFEYLSD